MVAEQGVNLPTGRACLVLEPANEVDDRDAVVTTVEKVAQDCQPGSAPAPSAIRVEQLCVMKCPDEGLHMSMDVTDDKVHVRNLGDSPLETAWPSVKPARPLGCRTRLTLCRLIALGWFSLVGLPRGPAFRNKPRLSVQPPKELHAKPCLSWSVLRGLPCRAANI